MFDSDKDIDINRLIRSRNHFDKVRAEEQESVILRWEEKLVTDSSSKKQFDKYERE